MIRDNEKYYSRIQVLVDAITIVISYMIAYYIQFTYLTPKNVGRLSRETYAYVCFVFVAMIIVLYSMFRLYDSERIRGRRLEAGKVFIANLLAVIIFISIMYMTYVTNVSRRLLVLFAAINFILTLVERNLIRSFLRNARRKGMNQKHMILVGYSKAAESFIDRVVENPQWGYHINGILDDNYAPGTDYRGVQVIGKTGDIEKLMEEHMQDEIAITLSLDEYYKLRPVVAACEKSGVHTKFIPDYGDVIPTKPYTEDLMGLPVINIRRVPLSDTFNMVVKRIIDIVLGSIALVIFSPVMLVTAILIKATSKGPLIFSQTRVGLHNKEFRMYKFRSMKVQTDEEEKKGWTVRDDPRVTKVGKFIRKTSIDELPQLINVLKGDMSLVGPRPERPQYVEKFREEIPRYMIKHQVRPGMTGWAQVNGYRGNTSIKKRIEYDIYYIENWTLGFDFKIMFLTIFRGFVNKNAY